MLLGKVCKYYQDSKCLDKRTHCDLHCSQMKYYGGNESDWLEEETCEQEKSNATHSIKKEPISFR